MGGRALRIVRVEDRLDGVLVRMGRGNGCGDPVARSVREVLVQQQGRLGPSGTDQMMIKPLLGYSLELPEEMELRRVSGVPPLF